MSKINGFVSLAIAKAGGSGITAIFWFIIAALLVPRDYGQIQYFISIAGIAYTISLIGTQEVIPVYTAKKIELQKTLISISLIAGTIIFGPILVMSTYFYEILAYRYVPTLIFFSIGMGMFFAKKSN